jgi:hypothetical protein
MTTIDPSVTVDYLDVDDTRKTFVGNADTLSLLTPGILYSATNALNEVTAQYLFPWSRILRLETAAGNYHWSGL